MSLVLGIPSREQITSLISIYPTLRTHLTPIKLSCLADLEITTEQKNKQWFIKDKKRKQTYSLTKGNEKLIVYQQSKPEILTYLFEVGLASQMPLAAGKLSPELIQGFETLKIPLSRRAQVSAGEDGVSWNIKDQSLEYNIRNENERLKVYLDLDSKWLRIRASDEITGWVQRNRGTIFEPPPPILSSRQLAKKRLLVLIDKVKAKVGTSNAEDKAPDAASR